MKKIIILMFGCLMLFGCSCKTNNNCNKNIADFKITITGTNKNSITNATLKDLDSKTLTITSTDAFGSKSEKVTGYKITDILNSLNISDYDFLQLYGDTGSVIYSKKKAADGYLIFYEDGVKLSKPKFVRDGTYNNYWVSNLNTINLTKDNEVA